MNDKLDIPRILLKTFARRVDYRPSVTSTNDIARELAPQADPLDALLVVADEQTAGRGRGSNRWWTGRGALAFSVLLDVALRGVERRHGGMIALAAALAVVETVEGLVSPGRSGLHWPNDVYVDDRKLAGVLVETLADGRHIVGVGCNVNNSLAHAPDELGLIVTSLRDLSGREHDRTAVLIDLLKHFQQNLEQLAEAPHELGRECSRRCLQHDRTLTIEVGSQRTTGICGGIADDGALVLDTAEGSRRFYSGVLVKQLPRY